MSLSDYECEDKEWTVSNTNRPLKWRKWTNHTTGGYYWSLCQYHVHKRFFDEIIHFAIVSDCPRTLGLWSRTSTSLPALDDRFIDSEVGRGKYANVPWLAKLPIEDQKSILLTFALMEARVPLEKPDGID